jgi:glycosyltransferase involved in cell wall biosynthesis
MIRRLPASTHKPRVVVVRGHQANPWELGPWQRLRDSYDVSVVGSDADQFDTAGVDLPVKRPRTVRGLLPRGRAGDLLTRVPGDRYLKLKDELRGADVVHSQELGYWYSMQAAKLRAELGFKLVVNVWETLPFLDAYRNVRTRPYRRAVLDAVDLFLPATERARAALLLEGAPEDRIRVAAPGVDLDRFGAAAASAQAPAEHLIVSPGRLVWEKGHQDVLRAVAALRRGVVGDGVPAPRVLIVGAGGEEGRLAAYARELGIEDRVELRPFVPYDEMPGVFASASCMVLASIPIWSWEEQFGMVLAEGMAAGLPIVASTSGAIPEVTGGQARYFAPGDWLGLARELADGPLAQEPGTRATYPAELLSRYSLDAAAGRLAAAYDELLA